MRSEALYLWDVVEAVDAIEQFIGSHTESEFINDDLLRSAVHSKLIIVGEAIANLSPALLEKYPTIPWHKIRGFRNAVIHGYFKVSWKLVWDSATIDALELRATCTEMLKNEFPGFDPELT